MINIIAAIGKNNELGKDNQLIWTIKEDLQYFKTITTGKTIVMGYNTYKSINKLLPNRINVVISRTEIKNGYIIMTMEEILNKYLHSEEEIFVIGGAKIYKDFIDYASNLYITEINAEANADVFFPKFDKNKYDLIQSTPSSTNKLEYKFNIYKKK